MARAIYVFSLFFVLFFFWHDQSTVRTKMTATKKKKRPFYRIGNNNNNINEHLRERENIITNAFTTRRVLKLVSFDCMTFCFFLFFFLITFPRIKLYLRVKQNSSSHKIINRTVSSFPTMF